MKIRTLILSLTLTLGFLVEAQRSPQDSWFLDRKIPFSQMPGLNVPYGIAFSEDGNLYVVDHGSDRITVWDTSGKFLKAWGRSGSADGQLNNPIDLAIGGGEIFVVEQSNHRVQVFDMDGNFIRKWGSHGTDPGKFRSPYSISLSMNGEDVYEVFVSEWDSHRVQVFDSNGTHQRTIGAGSYGGGENQFGYASGVHVDGNLLFASSRGYQKIKVFDVNGTYLRSISTSGYPYHLDSFGNLLAVTLADHHKVQIFDKNGTLIQTLGSSASTEPGKFFYNHGVAFDDSGRLHVSSRHNHRVQFFENNGTYLGRKGFYGSPNIEGYDFCVTPENTFLVTDVQDDRIVEFDENGTVIESIGSRGNQDGQFNDPRSIALHNGTIYVSDTSNHRLCAFDRNGTFLFKTGSYGNGNGQFNQPYGMIISEQSEEIYVADRNNHRIQVFDLDGNFVRKFGSYGNLEGQFNQPVDLAFNDDGSVAVLSIGNNRLINLTSSGQYISHWSTSGGSMHVENLNNGLMGIAWSHYIGLYENDGLRVKYWNKGSGQYSSFCGRHDGSIWILDRQHDEFLLYKPTYRTVRPPESKEIPLPEVIAVSQVEGTNYLEITYRINDADSSHVEATMLGFVDGGNNFSKIVIPRTFIGSIEGKLDNNVSTNQEHTVVWNAGTDWSVGFGEIEMAVLAKDDRNLLNLHFLSLPNSENNSSELIINRSPITNNDLLPLWYWHLAKGDPNVVVSPSMNAVIEPFNISNYNPGFSPASIDSLVLWLDANDSSTIVESNGALTKWSDKSGNERNATLGNGSPTRTYADGPNGLPFIQFRRADGEDFLNVSGTGFFAKHMFYICRSPVERWNYYGGILGHQSGRNSNYLFEANNFNYHGNQLPEAVYKNGLMLSQAGGFNMSPLTNFMVLEVVVNSNSPSTKTNYKVGRNDGYSMDFDVVEILAFDELLESEREKVLQYLSMKTNISLTGKILANNTSTTAEGRAYLFDLMGLREATTEEVTRAKEGSISGTINRFTPSFRVGPDERPNQVNEYSFDTGNTNGFWVVPK